jgi:hypothetical protein
MYSETDAGCQLVPEPDSDDGKDDRVVLMSMPGIFMVWSDSWACVPGLEKSETKKANTKRLKTRLNTCVLPGDVKLILLRIQSALRIPASRLGGDQV